MYQHYVKRFFDIIISSVCLIIASPILLGLFILVRIKLGSPVLFKQERAGYHNRMFKLYKFRSMTSETDENGELLPDEQRLPRFGMLLRATSLDELPELVNILKGDMSLVGPRPLLPNYVDLYSPRQKRRHEVKPGLTGLAQVNGRNAIGWEEKFEFDLEYTDRISFLLDARILFLTVKKVFFREDIQQEGEVTASAFSGTKKQRFGSKQKKVLHILFLSAGKQVELIQTFLYAAGNLGIEVVTYGADISLGFPAVLKCNHGIRTMHPKEKGYTEQILEIGRKNRIDLIVPLSEEDGILSASQEQFRQQGIRLLMSSKEVVDLCQNKRRVIDYLSSCGVKTLQPANNFQSYKGGYPAIIEVTDAQKGIYSYRVENEKELQYYIMRFDTYLLRPFVIGDEYEIDVFCDFDGNPIYITPMLREKNGEKELARYQIVQDQMMIREVYSIIETLKPVGILIISAIKEEKNGRNYYVAMRTVFSENMAISIKAGADCPLAILKLMYGTKLSYEPLAADNGIMFSRVEQIVQIKKEKNQIRRFYKFEELYDMGEDVEAVLFDLDDTLFSLKEYTRSGLKAVAEELPEISNCYNRMCAALEKGKLPIETILKEEGYEQKKLIRTCLDIFIVHEPEITLYDGITELFKELRRQKKLIAIVTDGKPVQQRNKINALGLRPLVDEILISDELAGNGDVHEFRKPNDIAYLIMKKRLGVALRNMAYVGEDAKIDFAAPLKLGMKCYQFVNEDRLYMER